MWIVLYAQHIYAFVRNAILIDELIFPEQILLQSKGLRSLILATSGK